MIKKLKDFFLLDGKLLYACNDFIGFNPMISKGITQKRKKVEKGTEVNVVEFEMYRTSFTMTFTSFIGDEPDRVYKRLEVIKNGLTIIRYEKGGNGDSTNFIKEKHYLVQNTDVFLIADGCSMMDTNEGKIVGDFIADEYYFFWFRNILVPKNRNYDFENENLELKDINFNPSLTKKYIIKLANSNKWICGYYVNQSKFKIQKLFKLDEESFDFDEDSNYISDELEPDYSEISDNVLGDMHPNIRTVFGKGFKPHLSKWDLNSYDGADNDDCDGYFIKDVSHSILGFLGYTNIYIDDSNTCSLENVNLSESYLEGINLCECNLKGTNLRNADINGGSLNGADLFGANLSGANLSGTDLSYADLCGANLCYANLCGANLNGADLSGAILKNADLGHTNLQRANLNGADLSGAKMSHSNLKDSKLIRAKLRNADLSYAALIFAELYEADLRDANLNGADFRGANLAFADLCKTNLANANFYKANLNYANLCGANICSADFTEAKLRGTNLSQVEFGGADLSHIILWSTGLIRE